MGLKLEAFGRWGPAWPFLGVAALILLTRLPFLTPSGDALVFNVDELELTYSSLDRFLGVPATNLAWPDSTLQATEVFVIAVLTAVRSGFEPSAGVEAMSSLVQRPWGLLIAFRVLAATAFALGAAALWTPFRTLAGRAVLAWGGVLLLATVPQVWLHTRLALGHGFALGFACAAFAAAMARPWSMARAGWSGFLCGLAVASRVTMAPMVFLLAGAGVEQANGSRCKRLLLFAVSGLAGFLLGCPYVWTDPLRLLKSVLGNVARGSEPIGLAGAAAQAAVAVGPPLAALALAGLVVLALARKWWAVGGAALSFAAFLLPAARSGVVYPRHLIGLAPLCVVVVFLALRERPGVTKPGGRRIATALVVVPIATNVMLFAWTGPGLGADSWQSELTARLANLEDGTLLLAPFWMYPYLAQHCSSEALKAEADQSRLRRAQARAAPDPPRLPSGAPSWLGAVSGTLSEDEQAFSARLSILASIEKPGLRVRFWATEGRAERFGVLEAREAVDLYLSESSKAVLVSDVPLKEPSFTHDLGGGLLIASKER